MQSAELRQMVADNKSSDTLYVCKILLLHEYYTNTLYPLYRDAICHPLYREEDTLFCVENTISPLHGEGVCHPLYILYL